VRPGDRLVRKLGEASDVRNRASRDGSKESGPIDVEGVLTADLSVEPDGDNIN
jgi:hypothetical protein